MDWIAPYMASVMSPAVRFVMFSLANFCSIELLLVSVRRANESGLVAPNRLVERLLCDVVDGSAELVTLLV